MILLCFFPIAERVGSKMYLLKFYSGAWEPACFPRLGRGKDSKKNAASYIKSAKERLVLKSAATAWAEGVPWATAVSISTRAIETAANGGVRKLPSKCDAKRAKAKAKPKALAKADS